MSKTRKILATLTMVAVATTASLTAVSSAQAHFAPWLAPHLHVIPSGPIVPGPGPIYTGPLFPGPLTPTPTPTPPPHHHGMKPGVAGLIGVGAGLLIGSALANRNQPAPAAAGLPTEHYLYCDKKYKTFVWQTNTFTGNDLQPHYCNSPWSY